MTSMESALNEFVAECREIIDRVNEGLLKLEQGERAISLIDAIYRDMHTMKGSAQLFGYKYIGAIAHAMESSLEPARKGKMSNFSGVYIESLLSSLRVIEKLFDAVSSGQNEESCREESEFALSKLVNAMGTIMAGPFNPISGGYEQTTFSVDVTLEKIHLQQLSSQIIPAKLEYPLKSKEKTMESVPEKLETRKESISDATTMDSTIRVPVQVLDKLMNLVGELVLVRNQVLQFSQRVEDLEFLNLSQNLNMVYPSRLSFQVPKTSKLSVKSVASSLRYFLM